MLDISSESTLSLTQAARLLPPGRRVGLPPCPASSAGSSTVPAGRPASASAWRRRASAGGG
jgi:hypothetical protein